LLKYNLLLSILLASISCDKNGPKFPEFSEQVIKSWWIWWIHDKHVVDCLDS